MKKEKPVIGKKENTLIFFLKYLYLFICNYSVPSYVKLTVITILPLLDDLISKSLD